MSSPPLVETPALDRYELVRQLGSGGMGAVYEGRHRITGRQVAIKVLHPRFATDRDIVERFFNEARAAAAVGHPNIVEVLDAGVAESGQPYLALEYLEGRSLAALLDEARSLDPARAVRIALQVVSALAAAHARGVVHRDLKPDNIFLSSREGQTDHVTVLDFGISRFHAAGSQVRTRAGAVLGTPAYMAPEQLADSSTVEGTADIYALGATLYQVLTGSLPFSADSLIALAAKIAREPPRPLEQLRPGLPPALCRVVLRAMAKDPKDRFGTMDELGAALAATAGVGWGANERTFVAAVASTPQSTTEAVELPLEALPQGRTLVIGAAVAGAAMVGALLLWRLTRETPMAPAFEVMAAASAPTATPSPALATPASPALPVAVGETSLTVPAARPGLVPVLPLVIGGKPKLGAEGKPADRLLLDRLWLEAGRVPLSLHELERYHQPIGALAHRFGYVTPVDLTRAWLALTLSEAHRGAARGVGDFTGGGCDEGLLTEGIAALAKARQAVDPNLAKSTVLEAANRGYTSYLEGVSQECQGDLTKAGETYAYALQVGDSLDRRFRRSVFHHRARLALAQGDAHHAQDMLDECYEATPSPEREILEFWASAMGWNCAGVLREARDLRKRQAAAGGSAPAWVDRVELACLLDPAAGAAAPDLRSVDAVWGEADGARRLEEARYLYADVSTPAAALRSALRLCYFRDRLAAPPETLAVTVSGQLEQPVLSGGARPRLDPLQACVARELAASHQQGPLTASTVELRVATGP